MFADALLAYIWFFLKSFARKNTIISIYRVVTYRNIFSSVNSFKNNLGKFWIAQEVYYNCKCDIPEPQIEVYVSLSNILLLCRAGLCHSAALSQLSSPPLFSLPHFRPLSFPSPFLLPPPRPEAATPPIPFCSFLSLLFPFRPSISLTEVGPITSS